MAKQINEEIALCVKELITQMSGFQDGTEVFSYIEKHIITTLKKSDTMYFLNKREVNRTIASMAEKFTFHGFSPQAKALQDFYKRYVPENLPKSELINRLNIVKLLLCLSERPTSKFIENPEEFHTENVEEEDDINWAEYLNEGIETWNPNYDETSDDSESTCSETEVDCHGNRSGPNSSRLPVIVDSTEKDIVVDFRTNREELLATIQHTWYNAKRFRMAPFSEWREANIGILWDEFLEEEVKGLIPIEKSNVLTEYKAIREILWQMWNLHNSATFKLEGDNIKLKSNVTISSARAETFENFLGQFVPYMEVLDFFRDFSRSVETGTDVPQTFGSYNESLQKILRPVYRKLSELEDKVREQETTYTLLKLCCDLEVIFEPVLLLKKIHDEVVIDYKQNSAVLCAVTLLSGLHNGLQHSTSKLEQDLRLTLFLESLYYYFKLVNSWLMKNDLSDYTGEFVIVNKNKKLYGSPVADATTEDGASECESWMLNFKLREGVPEQDGIIRIIKETVLQIGRNIHLLRVLGNFFALNDCKETIHEEFIRRSLKELEKFFDVGREENVTDEEFYDCMDEKKYKYPVVCPDDCIRPTDFDKLENLVDTTDGFLMLAFQEYFVEKSEITAPNETTLFDRVSKITKTMFPTSNFFERILDDLLRSRFTVSGLMVKNILIENYLLEKQFQFLRHVFLFWDDMIFPFYRGLFEKINARSDTWGNDVWLTAHLQDVIVDVYPEFYEKCSVQIQDGWRQCWDPLEACGMVGVQFEVDWPLNIVVTSAQMARYREIFAFLMQIKWALHTVNRLVFTDIEPKKQREDIPKIHRNAIAKLKFLKFSLTNLLYIVQHYLFSFAFTKSLQKFELDFEKANDLSSIMASHSDYINSIHEMVKGVKEAGKGFSAFENIMNCVDLLKMMWTNLDVATLKRLNDCYDVYKLSYSAIEPIVCPVYLFDY